MNSTNDKIKGNANSAIGTVKEAVGNVTGNEQTKLEGEAQKLKGEAQKATGAIKDALHKGLHVAADAMKKAGEKIEHLGE